MPRFVTSTVTEILRERPGLQRVGTDAGRAYALTDLTGPVAVGDAVVLNTTAVELGLGTGGWHVVHWNLARDEWSQPGPGHIMKLRYTSLQADVGAAEEQHPDLPSDLGGRPVVACSLHSQVGVVAAVVRSLRPTARIAYVMTDGAALPLALSDLLFDLRDRGIVDGTVTAGHAFGGELEAVTVASGLVLARHVLGADVTIVGMGPGVVGTGSALGTTAIEVAGILDTVAALGGRGALCVRASDADPRERHRGVSHHTATVLQLLRSQPAVPLPAGLAAGLAGSMVCEPPDVPALLAEAGLRITSMGRGPDDDPAFYAAAGAAATWAAAQLST
ncbi:MAG TPA: DUF3866 family protein [Acidimicrobiales bacterium]|jgi:hypothetical protein|nr:DUF3866 family protein [Acidimicrobiales bacterium]